ncbi:MAG TPA: DinB family protein [Nitrososphaerales archaeon]|nr:DinB family protein [Nitrososphaerales archaeon]
MKIIMLSIFELQTYSTMVRRRFAEKLSELPWEFVNKNREASYYSMKNILLHMIDNEDWMVNWVVKNDSKGYVREKKFEEYLSMQIVLDHLQDVENKTRKYMQNVKDEDLKQRAKLITSKGVEFDLSVEECLFQSFTEQLYHIGELIALLWQENVEPPKMQWFYNNPRMKS